MNTYKALWLLLLSAVSIFQGVAAGPYSEYILTPASRTLIPATVHKVNGSVAHAASLTNPPGNATFKGSSAVTYDFGKNIAGIVSFNVSTVTGTDEFIGISFTESSLWINSEGCDATADAGIDEALWFKVSSGGHYAASKVHQRGAFRYLNVYHNTSGTVELQGLSVYFTALPQVAEADLRTYSGYFHCNDEQLNRVWYAGAYTDQLCTIEPTAGDSLVHLGVVNSTQSIPASRPLTWYYNYTISNGSSVLVDGAKRDRLVWPGDMSIAVPSMFVSTNDLVTVKNSLESLLILQNSTGALPYAGVPFGSLIHAFSFTYHLYSLIGLNDYYLYTGDINYLAANWEKFKLGLNYSLGMIDSSGMANVTTSADWLRFGMGGHNIEANAILYYTINLGLSLADVLNDTTVTSKWSKYAVNIKSAANAHLWDPSANLYRDNDTVPLTKLHPQDGNAWAVVSNLTLSQAQSANISTALAKRWGKYGAPAPEAGPTVSPFISGFELQAHYLAGQPQYAVQLMKRMWADFMLDDPRMTNSTFVEGYSTNGDLHYAPYTNDPRISHAHGWATGPTSALTFYSAGLQITSAVGKTWRIAPSLGGLTSVEAGFETSLGSFATNVTAVKGGMNISFATPKATVGGVSLEYPAGDAVLTIRTVGGGVEDLVLTLMGGASGRMEIDGLPGGNYEVEMVSRS